MQCPQGCPLGYLEGTSHLVRLTDKVDRALEHGWFRAALPALHGFCAGAAQEVRNTRLYSTRFTCRYVEKFSGLGDVSMNERYLISAAVYARPLP